MIEGFWIVQFEGMRGNGGGVLVLLKGQVFGGDNGYLYKGDYETDNRTVTAQVSVHQFLPGVPSVLGVDGNVELLLKGNVTGEVITAKASVANQELPGLVVKLTRVSGLPV
jgi:hypothetical protein